MTTHYVSTLGGDPALTSIIPAALRGRMLDDGNLLVPTINNAPPSSDNNCNPPVRAAWQALANTAHAADMGISLDGESLLLIGYPQWLADQAACQSALNAISTGLGYMADVQPTLRRYVSFQMTLGQSIAAPRPQWATYMTAEAAALNPHIDRWTMVTYFNSTSDLPGWTADLNFIRGEAGTYYPSKQGRMFASPRFGDTGEYIGAANMQATIDYGNQHDLDIVWWSAGVIAPFPQVAFDFLAGLPATLPSPEMPSAFESLFRNARALLLAQHGTQGVPYAAGDAAPVNVTAIVGAVADETIQIDDTRTLYRHRPITVSTVDVPDPARGDKLTIDAEVWTVHERLPQDGGMVRLLVVRPTRAEFGGRGLGR